MRGLQGLRGLRGLRGLQKLQGEAAGRGCRQGLQAGAAGRGCRGRVGLQGCSTHPISSAPPAQSDVPSQTCLPCTHVPSGQNQPGVSSAEVVHWKPPEVPWYAVRTARPRLAHAYPVRTVRGASGQAALRLWYAWPIRTVGRPRGVRVSTGVDRGVAPQGVTLVALEAQQRRVIVEGHIPLGSGIRVR